MHKCEKCGIILDEGVVSCPGCGAAGDSPEKHGGPVQDLPAPSARRIFSSSHDHSSQQEQPPQQGADYGYNATDSERTMSVLGYVFFPIPLIKGAHKDSPFVRHHTNQGIALWILTAVCIIIHIILSAVIQVELLHYGEPMGVYGTPPWLTGLLWLLFVPIITMMLMGIVDVIKEQMKPLPLVGWITVLRK